jgi:hypothetical protein
VLAYAFILFLFILILQFQTDNLEPFMLNNHRTHVIDKNSILMIGGGGICFTFGTHLNRQPVILDLKDCWTFMHNQQNEQVENVA